MPPNKPKLYKNTNKNPPKSQAVQVNQLTPQPSSSTVEIPNQEQFEVELCWCILQLQQGLGSGKLNNKQVQDHTRSLNTLMSNTAPLIKKRQVMRLCFGDYREKMALEEKRISKKAANMKLIPATTNKKTVFLKKSLFSSNMDNTFKFNFNIEEGKSESENTTNTVNNTDIEESKTVNNSESVHFVQSDNSFKFDFNIDTDS